MAGFNLTSEQKAVINHPIGYHARVLAVAGSGKTTTMAYRIQHLIQDVHINPASIRVLMFNRLARYQFIERLKEIGLSKSSQPNVQTFHAFSGQFISSLVSKNKIPGDLNYWVNDKEELIRITVLNAINKLEKEGLLQESEVDPDIAMQAISLWKGSLIPPDRAGFKENIKIPLVYREYEKIRNEKHAITFDDFIPIVIGHLQNDAETRADWNGRAQNIIVDEYQDVNYGQQRLIELLAGDHADIMVIGDDDQTIYEWRGARPNYIIQEFIKVFHNKPHKDYHLSNSFRFGPIIAQCAYNTIKFNKSRVEKSLVSRFIEKPTDLQVVEHQTEQETDTNKELAQQIALLVRSRSVDPSKVIVLCRMFAQLSGIQTQFLAYKIPFRVIGQQPFWNRREIRVLLEYLEFAINLNEPANNISRKWLIDIVNTPSRKIKRDDISNLMDGAILQSITNRQALQSLVVNPNTPLYSSQQERIIELIELLDNIQLRINDGRRSGELLEWIVNRLDYLSHFDNYYGKGEESFDRKESITNFIIYATQQNRQIAQFIDDVKNLDSTRGVPEDQQIVMTTVFRTKGLEYDYVFIPDCTEGFFPCLYESNNMIFDKTDQIQEPIPSESIENERRLFYVAITRAKKGAYIGTTTSRTSSHSNLRSILPSRFIDEMQYQPTIDIMKPLQQVISGKEIAVEQLMKAIYLHGDSKQIIDFILKNYLERPQHNDIIEKIQQVLKSGTDLPFSYRYNYAASSKNPRDLSENKPKTLHQAWEDIDF